MFAVVVEFTLHPNKASAFRQRVLQQARDSLEQETQCHVFDVCTDPGRDDFVLLYEVYTNRDAFDAHLQSAHFVDFDQTVRGWVSHKRISVYDRLDSGDTH